ncbi:DNA ligase D [Streptomyces caniscabiei]|uniref:DNA ligase D n=1 Tax=Streptomyces caniscabiei TaxID=2746961 RepID=UPI0029B6CC5B|nr:DNA ligase D [Streptomyces caniscabiei]MDX2776000.1 DNA ligase D [Streptomyces caniscabiei]
MGLKKYFSKRAFDMTPEPKGEVKKAKSKQLAFVMQEHHASRLHYDFRLELDGVLKSWAVPKGPSMDPHDRHLAVQVEDHPYEYRNFEGTIPKGNYGAGNVIVWDEGTYEPYHDGPDDEATLRKELAAGHLTFFLHGKKLNGEFALIKMRGKDPKAWLLIKKGDEFASTEDVTHLDTSVKSGKKVDELDGGSGHTSIDLQAYPKVKTPWRVKPMLCTLVDEAFDDSGWLYEIKWDGYRAVGSKQSDTVELYSRANNDFSEQYPPVTEALRALKHDVILDGEIVVTDSGGMPHFELLQNWRRGPTGQLYYYVFDILWCDGYDVRDMPLVERKNLLQSVIPAGSIIRYSDHMTRSGTKLFKAMQEHGLEGIVAKKADSAYREGYRGTDWLKIKTHLRQEVVIGGYTEPRGGRKYLGALVVGVYNKEGALVYTGHSGGGIPDMQRKLLQQKLSRLERKTSPFATTPKTNAPVHWVKPELVCEMSFTEWTSEGSMRHPVFEGMRSDKDPKSVHREKPKGTTKQKEKAVKEPHIEFTHLDKVFFPKHGYTKGDILHHYESVADYILPYLKDRPLSLLRQPNGITGEGFFQKNMEHLPDWVPSADIFSESNSKDLHWVVGGKLETLQYIVQLGSIEVNPWNSRVGHLDNPDWLVIDLDPEGAITFKNVITVAKEVKQVCDEWGIPTLPKTSGKTGIHIFVPLGAKYSYEQAKNLAHLIVLEVNKRQPKLTSVERTPSKRPNKIYLDFLQNRSGQTLAAPYSLRPTPDATVSTPLHWDEVTPSLKPTDYTIKNIKRRLARTGDLWRPILKKGVNLEKVLKEIEKQ